MKLIKRNGSEVVFDITKIINAIGKANEAVDEEARMTPLQIKRIAEAYQMEADKVREMVPEDSIAEDMKVKKAMELIKENAVAKQ